jgi:two-component system, sensor histidine kinase and response regulator
MTKILVIEDEDNIRDILIEILEAENFEVIEAADGQRGLKVAQEALPDLIICDIMMPELDGYEVLNQLRQNSATETIPFIFLTAKTAEDDRRQGMTLGADDYLTKPFTRDQLLTAIAARVKKQLSFNRQSQQKLNELRSNILHALPQNGILGLSRILSDTYDLTDREEALEMLEEIYTSGERLYRLTQNFLLYAEMELIAIDPERVEAMRRNDSKTPTQKLITDVAIQKAQQAKREADLHLDCQEVIVQIPEVKLKKILEEIIDNAFKFSSANTPVHIISTFKDNTCAVSLIDQGRGMTAAQIANLGAYLQFERKLYEQQGSGLGLVIAKRLVELYGGKLIINSSPSQQTIVNIALPVK